MEGIVSLPTRLSQIALKLVTIENDNSSSDQTPKDITQKSFIGILWKKRCNVDAIISKFLIFYFIEMLKYSLNLTSSDSDITDDSIAKFSSELLLFMLRGITIPTGRSFLFGTASVRSYVVQLMPDDESDANSLVIFLFRLCFNRYVSNSS